MNGFFFVIANNASEILLGGTWTGVILWGGIRIGRKLERRRLRKLGVTIP
jgi:hypothetical protein